jgi:hypothetical protein
MEDVKMLRPGTYPFAEKLRSTDTVSNSESVSNLVDSISDSDSTQCLQIEATTGKLRNGSSDSCFNTSDSNLSSKNTGSEISLEKNWKIITYVSLPSVDSFVIALTIADQVSHFSKSAELSKERRIKTDQRRLLKECTAFVDKYKFLSVSHCVENAKLCFADEGKLLISLNYNLGVIGGGGGCINYLKSGGRTLKLCELIVVLKHSNNMWYPASRRLIKFLFSQIVDQQCY